MRAAILVLVVAACGDNLAGVTLEDYLAARRDADCKYLVHCGFLRDLETCERANLGREHVNSRFAEAVHAGSIIWYPRAAAECLAQAETLSCDRADPAHRYACGKLWEPTLRDGETCTLSDECISGECWLDDGLDLCAIGYCVGSTAPVPAPLGESCRIAACAEGYCDDHDVCLPLNPDGAPCRRDLECESGLSCGFPDGCTRLPDRGEPCLHECRRDGDRCNSKYVCAQGGTLGVPCVVDADCSSFYRCGAAHECVEPELHIGDRCDRDDQCRAPDSFCDIDTRTCMLPKADGTRCFQGSECESWLCNRYQQACVRCD